VKFDVIVVGAGAVGLTVAAAMANLNYKVAIIEARKVQENMSSNFDSRSIALSYGSAQIFRKLGFWEQLSSHATKISDIHISEQGSFGLGHISAEKEDVEALGFVVAMPNLCNELLKSCLSAGVELLDEQKILSITDSQYLVDLKTESSAYNCKLLIAADGVNSFVRKQTGIDVNVINYKQTAIVANLSLKRSHNNIAYERFTKTGPMAILPLSDNRAGLVWTQNDAEAKKLVDKPEKEFLMELQESFGYRVGRFEKVGQRMAFPLKLVRAEQQFKGRTVLLGNSAHNIHPVAGQGFNLSMRDINQLILLLKDDGLSLTPELLASYAATRKKDQSSMTMATDGLVKLYSNELFLPGLLRNLGLNFLDRRPYLKSKVNKFMMGVRHAS
jgi:2-octaprenyl-6-methoxyphenol hydroxylase